MLDATSNAASPEAEKGPLPKLPERILVFNRSFPVKLLSRSILVSYVKVSASLSETPSTPPMTKTVLPFSLVVVENCPASNSPILASNPSTRPFIIASSGANSLIRRCSSLLAWAILEVIYINI